jgi:hypothetical protein
MLTTEKTIGKVTGIVGRQVVGSLNPEDETVLIPWVQTMEGDRQLGAPFLASYTAGGCG